ncbi:30S ribosomal protein S8 [Candidatus Curtissbacteria bacterium RIFCSPLOWO2_01_FULL_41_18]|uniref:Small ribosomal subunit protein uS8 n=2 Tax=Candidatus Curtissiibacteriota TaxID=1752717 RepID=A0A1F5FYJ9_9BACT|nr:MAG: 30S ribosomal protein S8 [Candidatus Curtissbacteria bacterium RIFCSPHIGHO2_01_FULL_41_13]OGE05086.1 MAG: 30S ribosomal protein S8 [Candidatus Curtissbacteria bacterium RIFCSPLOWO2_01_FULL_41_18]
MDPIADMLVAIKNGYMAKKSQVLVPYSKFKFEIAKVLEKENFVGKTQKKDNLLLVDIIYDNKNPKLHQIKKVSKLGLRIYIKSKNIKKVKGGRGITIISTPKGVMAGHDAKKKNLGGEVICQVW